MRFATASAESRAAIKQSLQSITALASAQVEKSQQMMAIVAHNKVSGWAELERRSRSQGMQWQG